MRLSRQRVAFLRPIGILFGSLRTLLLLSLPIADCDAVHGAPIAFRFAGLVTSIDRSPTGSFDLPFELAVGSPMNGLVQFEPIAFGENGRVTNLQLSLTSAVFVANDISLRTFNNHQVPGMGLVDAISVDCSATTICAGAISSVPVIAVEQMGLGFSSTDVNGFDLGEDLGNVDFWNGFELPDGGLGFSVSRTFHLQLYSSMNPSSGTVDIRGSVGLLEVVAEPSAMLATLGALMCILTTSRRRL